MDESLVFISSVPVMLNLTNPEDNALYSADSDKMKSTVPGNIVSDITNILNDCLKAEKEKGEGIAVSSLASTIDEMFNSYAQSLIDVRCDYFIIKDFQCYVHIKEGLAYITFLARPGDVIRDKDYITSEKIKVTTRAVINGILAEDEELREKFAESNEAVLYLLGYVIINQKSPIALYFPDSLSCEQWLAKFNKSLKDFPYLTAYDMNSREGKYDFTLDDGAEYFGDWGEGEEFGPYDDEDGFDDDDEEDDYYDEDDDSDDY